MKPEQLEIAQLKREVAKLKAERDMLKKPRPTSGRNRREVRFHLVA
jgi:transposase